MFNLQRKEKLLANFSKACSVITGTHSLGKEMKWKIKVGVKNPYKAVLVLLSLVSSRFTKTPIKVNAKTFWHEKMTVILPEPVSLSIFLLGFFEEGLTRMVLENVSEGDVFIDVGAHFGYYTLLSSLLVGATGQVHSFEPTPSTYEILQRNTSNKHSVITNNYALHSENREIPFNDYGLVYSAFNSFTMARLDKKTLQKNTPKEIMVKAIRLDEYVKEKGIKKWILLKLMLNLRSLKCYKG